MPKEEATPLIPQNKLVMEKSRNARRFAKTDPSEGEREVLLIALSLGIITYR